MGGGGAQRQDILGVKVTTPGGKLCTLVSAVYVHVIVMSPTCTRTQIIEGCYHITKWNYMDCNNRRLLETDFFHPLIMNEPTGNKG